jgi:hypothetical protein
MAERRGKIMKKEPADPIGAHLEYFGYSTRTMPDGWSYSEHAKRLNLFYRRFPFGWRFHAIVLVGRSLGEIEGAMLAAINAVNDKSVLVKLSVGRDSDGDFVLRARSVFSGEYRKQDFGLFLDIWNSDLELLSEVPAVPTDLAEEEPSGAVEGVVARLPN